jgi:two-component system nitrogen regulation sensor histidine kinase NtrY
MFFKNFRFQIVLRVLLICATLYLFFHLLFNSTMYVTIIFLLLIVIYQIVALIRYAESTSRQLSRFLQSIRHADFSQSFTAGKLGSSFSELSQSFSDVISDFRKIREEKEEHYRYLQTVVQHVGIGLIGYHKDGEVELLNPAVKRLLQVGQLRRIQHLRIISPVLAKTLMNLHTGERSLVKIFREGEMLQLAIYATEFRLKGREVMLVSLQNIQSELEEKEAEAWQKLIRVLTHEIMNSVTPISSLAGTVNDLLLDINPDSAPSNDSGESLQDVREAVQTIQKRSEGLVHFVEAYRSLTRLPQPKFQEFSVQEAFSRLHQLNEEKMRQVNIRFSSSVIPHTLKLTADPEMIEQVLLNLLKNAIEALENKADARIDLKGFIDDRGRVVIQVSDNGPGISQDIQEKIFIPFFTTRKEGSGIGLSLSRQIVRLHKGNLTVSSDPDQGSTFTIRF